RIIAGAAAAVDIGIRVRRLLRADQILLEDLLLLGVGELRVAVELERALGVAERAADVLGVIRGDLILAGREDAPLGVRIAALARSDELVDRHVRHVAAIAALDDLPVHRPGVPCLVVSAALLLRQDIAKVLDRGLLSLGLLIVHTMPLFTWGGCRARTTRALRRGGACRDRSRARRARRRGTPRGRRRS